MKLRLSVTNGWRPPFFCCGTQWDSHVWQMQTTTMNNQHLNLVCHRTPWSSQRIPSSSISIIAIVKWSEEICQTSDNGLDKSDHILTATTSLSKEVVHSICHVNLASKSIITSSKMKKLVVKKGTQSEVSARPVPSWVPPQILAGQSFLFTIPLRLRFL